MSRRHRNRHGRHHGPPPGVPKNPRFKKPPKAEQKFDFTEWYEPIREAIQRGIHFTKPDTDEATLVITTAAIFEKTLEFMIILNFGSMPSLTDMDLIFAYPGPLASFAAKINLCSIMGHLTPTMRHDLNIIRDIRNKFCHSLLKRSFSDHDIAKDCADLKYGRGLDKDGSRLEDMLRAFDRFKPAARVQYTVACMVLLSVLMLMYVRKFQELKALEPLKQEILDKAKAIFDEKFSELVKKAGEGEAQAPQHPAPESTAPGNTEEGQTSPLQASPESAPEPSGEVPEGQP